MSGSAEPAEADRPAEDATALLRGIGQAPSHPFDIAEAALALAALDRPQVALDRYRLHLADIARTVAEAAEHGNHTAAGRAAMLADVLHRREGYRGDADTYDDLQNANLMRVIDRRRGLPVALGILYLHAARAQGWRAHGLAFPGHFLIALDAGTERTVLDPFSANPVAGASALRTLLKSVVGASAELTPECYTILDDRRVLLRLLNNIKTRLAAQGQFRKAVAVTERMLLIAPEETALYRDLGVFHAEVGNLKAAIEALDTFVANTSDEEARHIAAALAQKIAARLN
jgi:regulator of sirC expression with transglutaminase-like and TPR domain